MGTVLQFPGVPREPDPVPDPQPTPAIPAEADPWSFGTFLDWVFTEVGDFGASVSTLADKAEADPDEFWSEVERLRTQINGWRRA